MIDEQVKQFIEDNVELIEQNRWEELYQKDFPYSFTETLLESGINPLKQGLNYIPEYFLYKCKVIEEFIIPNNITTIGNLAFCDCTSLTNVVIPNSIKNIGVWAFSDCKSLTSITYLGTKKEAIKAGIGDRSNKNWREFSNIRKITCTDGVIDL